MDDPRKLAYRAQVEALGLALDIAIRTRDMDAFTAAARQMLDIAQDMGAPSEVRNAAAELHRKAALNCADEGLKAMRQTVAGLGAATAELQNAIEVAKKGKAGLIAPKLASAANDALTSFNNLKDSVNAVQADLKNASEAQLGDVPQRLTTLLTDLQKLKSTLKG
jgi:hypothetical protein